MILLDQLIKGARDVFIVGLIVGPALGLVGTDYLLRSGVVPRRLFPAILALVLLVVALLPIFQVELKVGLLIGMPLGLLLSTTPSAPEPAGVEFADRTD